jgi:xanthine dehydrogenase molybdopterin-binding subunit B
VAGYPRHIRVLDSKVRCVGDAVALVAAETAAIAEEALMLIDVEYEPLPAIGLLIPAVGQTRHRGRLPLVSVRRN